MNDSTWSGRGLSQNEAGQVVAEEIRCLGESSPYVIRSGADGTWPPLAPCPRCGTQVRAVAERHISDAAWQPGVWESAFRHTTRRCVYLASCLAEGDGLTMSTSPLKLVINEDTGGEPSGYDSMIARVPPGWYAVIGGERCFLARQVGQYLREQSRLAAANLGERLHHAEWTITGDPAEVQTLGLMHDCPACRASVDQAQAWLRDDPAGEIAVGQLWWARS